MSDDTLIQVASVDFNDPSYAELIEFQNRVKALKLSSTRASLRGIYSLPVMQQVRAMNALGTGELEALDALEGMCNQQVAYLLSRYEVSTVSSLLTRYRKVMDNNGLDTHPYALYMIMPRELVASLKNDYAGKLMTENRNLRAFSNPMGFIETAIRLVSHSGRYIEVAMGLCALTGRRPGEILTTAEFSLVRGYEVNFKGQLKTKGRVCEDNFNIPTLTDGGFVVEGLARLRNMKDLKGIHVPNGKTLGQAVNARTCKDQNLVVKDVFGKFFNTKITAYALRPAYALIAASWYKPETMTQRAYYSQILGHAANDTSSAAAYEDFYLVDDGTKIKHRGVEEPQNEQGGNRRKIVEE